MDSKLVAIDPGLHVCGVAEFEDGRLVAVRAVEVEKGAGRGPTAWSDMAKAVDSSLSSWLWSSSWSLVVEYPEIYTHGKSRPDDILQVAGVVGALVTGLHGCTSVSAYRPKVWKKQLPKAVHHRRVKERLSLSERTWFSKTDHNGRDAVGLGLYELGRYRP